MGDAEFDFIRMGLFLGYGVCIAVVFIHASSTDKNTLFWTAIAFIPIFGIIFYFLAQYVHGIGDSARRAKVHKERDWEFILTDKGKKIDPNKPKVNNDKGYVDGGVTKDVIAATPPSREINDDD